MVCIPIMSVLKSTSIRNRKISLRLGAFVEDPDLCVMLHLKEYLQRTESLRGKETQLFIRDVPPHTAVTKETLSRWLKAILEESGIDTDIFAGHSTRAASCSHARLKGVPMDDILKTAGWSSCQTFQKFYSKPIVHGM